MISNPQATFDPYHVWLGIPLDEQPADHYRLLGIPRFESSDDVIESAADRQMAHVRSFQGGIRSKESQKLLNEISAARGCLLNPTAKQKYDDSLRERASTRWDFDETKPVTSVAAEAEVAISTDAPRVRRQVRWQPIALWAGLAGVIVTGCVVFALQLGSDEENVERPAPVEAVGPVARLEPAPRPAADRRRPTIQEAQAPLSAVVEEVTPPEDQPQGFADLSSEFDALASLPQEANAPSVEDVFVDGTSEPVGVEDRQPSELPAAPERFPIPTDEELAVAESAVNAADGKLLQKGNRKRNARELLDLAKSADVDPAVRYYLFELAKAQALKDEDVELASQTLDEAALRFEMDAWQERFDLLYGLNQADFSRSALGEMLAGCHKLMSAALAEGRFERAVQVGQLAVEATNRPQAGHLRANAQALLETARQLDAQHREYISAKADLETNPSDSEAHLTVGRWLCFVLDDWSRGLPHLAKCGDPDLAEAAKLDLAAQNEVGDLVEVGDAWWTLAGDQPATEVIALKQRAIHWYEISSAQPQNSLTDVRIEQRIAEGRLLERPFRVGHVSTEQPDTEAWRRPIQ